MGKIRDIRARQILDSRGNPTIEVAVTSENNISAVASVPSGASTGTYEALELRDNDMRQFGGKSVNKAIENVNSVIFQELKDRDSQDQAQLDLLMCEIDGTENKSKLGANAILGVSLAIAKLSAEEQQLPLYHYLANIKDIKPKRLPMPLINIINGGAHADNKLAIQEFMIVPVGANSFSQAIQMGCEIFYLLKEILKKNKFSTNVGDEGGYAPGFENEAEAIEYILEAIERSNYNIEKDIAIAIDAAANEFYDKEKSAYFLRNQNLAGEEMIAYWIDLSKKYPIISIEDPLAEDDWTNWQNLTKSLPMVQIVGDDLFTTNSIRLKKGIKNHSANAILVKMNQIGTLTETIEVIDMAKKNNFECIISHRSGETEDTTIADLAIAFNTGQIKTGSMSRTDRVAKYNRLLKIEEELGKDSIFVNPFESNIKIENKL